jgi:AcrR family transcriptional regulator
MFTERSKLTREAILAAARHRFTERGYDRTTIRLVALDAEVDPSMVMRYYGSKRGLFAAAVDVDLRLPDAASVPIERVGEVLARHFSAMWEDVDQHDPLAILLRSAVTHADAAARLRDVFAQQVVEMVRRVTGDAADADVRAGLLGAQLLGLALARHILRLPPLASLEQARILPYVAQTLHHLLFDPLPLAGERDS